MKYINGKRRIRIVFYGLAILCITLVYWIISHIIDNVMILPKIKIILSYLLSIEKSDFINHIASTMIKVLISYMISTILALLLAIIAHYKKLYLMINPYMSILKTIPTISIILILFIWFGNEQSIYFIPIIVIIPILYETFHYHLKNIDHKLVDVTKVYQFNVSMKVRYLFFYPLLEAFMLSLKQTFGLCFKIIVMAEVIGQAKNGIGAKIQNEKINLTMEGVFAWTIILISIVLVIDFIIDFSTRKAVKWKCNHEN